MIKSEFRAIISIVVFVLCLAVTFPFVSGIANFTSMFEREETTGEQPSDETTYDPYDPSWLFGTTDETTVPETPDAVDTTNSPEVSTAPDETSSPEESTSCDVTTPENTTEPITTQEITTQEITTQIITTHEITTTVETGPEDLRNTYPWLQVDKSYFDDALFIGDSRTIGLGRAGMGGLLETATFFAGESWTCPYAMNTAAESFYAAQTWDWKEKNVFPKVFHGVPANNNVNDQVFLGRMSLESLLKSRTWGKIYIMFGINEIGYADSTIVNNVARMITMCKTIQPNAIIYIEGNLYMTAKYSANNKYGDNKRLAAINSKLSALANWKDILYIDVNDLMGDGKGNAAVEYCGENSAHPLVSKYKDWAKWLYTKGYNPDPIP